MTLVQEKRNIWSLYPVSEMTDGWGPLDSFRMRAGGQKDQALIREFECSASLQPPEMDEGAEIVLITNGQ